MMDLCEGEIELVIAKLEGVQPRMLDEDKAYRKAIMRMAINEYISYIKENDAVMQDAFARHG